jgi:hypothetical protein
MILHHELSLYLAVYNQRIASDSMRRQANQLRGFLSLAITRQAASMAFDLRLATDQARSQRSAADDARCLRCGQSARKCSSLRPARARPAVRRRCLFFVFVLVDFVLFIRIAGGIMLPMIVKGTSPF